MRKTYGYRVINSPIRSVLTEEVNPPLSDLYIKKDQGWLSFAVSASPALQEAIKPVMYSLKDTKTHTVFTTNTLNFDLSNIKVNGKAYRYKLVNADKVADEVLAKHLDMSILVKSGGQWYTNFLLFTKIDQLEVYSESLATIWDCQIIYRANHMEVKAPLGFEPVFKETVLEPSQVNNWVAHIPSFYLRLTDRTIRCVESNVIYNLTQESDKPSYPLRGVQEGVSYAGQKVLKPGLYETFKSTHCFGLRDLSTTFCILDDGSITDSGSNLSFTINKVVDLDKVMIIPNKAKRLSYRTDIDPYVRNSVLSYKELNPELHRAGVVVKPTEASLPSYNYISAGTEGISMSIARETSDMSWLERIPRSDINTTWNAYPFADVSSKPSIEGVVYDIR